MNTRSELDAAAVAAVDQANQIGDVLAMAEHIDDALWRVESARLEPEPAAGLLICGMGGSAIGGDLAIAALGGAATAPIAVSREYGLPPWIAPGTAVLCSSYSGNTEETLACYDAAGELGARRYVAAAGGLLAERAHSDGVPVIGIPGVLQPRASVAYMTIAALAVAAATGVASAVPRSEFDAAAAALRARRDEWGPGAGGDSLAKRLARAADGRLVAVYGNDLTAPVAYRWKCQINENVKVPCWSAVIPESNHNDINGWGGAPGLGEHAVWFLRDEDQHERVSKRFDLTAGIVGEAGVAAEVIDTEGSSRVERLFTTILLGDLVSLYMATLRGVDPSPVPVIENLKDALGRPSASSV